MTDFRWKYGQVDGTTSLPKSTNYCQVGKKLKLPFHFVVAVWHKKADPKKLFSIIFSISVIKICRYIRFHPITWHKRIGMRAAILGCRHKGDCGAGFMQVNSGSSCGKAFYNSNSIYIESMICISYKYNYESNSNIKIQCPSK